MNLSFTKAASLVPEALLLTEYSSITHSSWDYELLKNAAPYDLKVPLLSYKERPRPL